MSTPRGLRVKMTVAADFWYDDQVRPFDPSDAVGALIDAYLDHDTADSFVVLTLETTNVEES